MEGEVAEEVIVGGCFADGVVCVVVFIFDLFVSCFELSLFFFLYIYKSEVVVGPVVNVSFNLSLCFCFFFAVEDFGS